MGYTRAYPNLAAATSVYVGSSATSAAGLLAATNPGRAELKLQGVDAFYMGVTPSVSGSAGLFVPSGVISPAITHTGPVYGLSAAANGATIAIRAWESTQ